MTELSLPARKTRIARAGSSGIARAPFPMSHLALLEMFKPQESQGVARKQKTSANPRVKEIEKAFKKSLKGLRPDDSFLESGPKLVEAAKPLKCSPDEILEFSIRLSGSTDELALHNAGLFLSALINNSKDRKFAIQAHGALKPIPYIGYCNKKEVIVHGDAGTGTCTFMVRGKVTINGDVGLWLGDTMTSGKIFVNGNLNPTGFEIGRDSERNVYIWQNGKPIVQGGKVVAVPENK